MHTNNNNNNDNGTSNANKSTTTTTLKTLINYTNNNCVNNNNNYSPDNRLSSSFKSSKFSSCGPCLRYQRGQQRQLPNGEQEDCKKRQQDSFGGDCRRMTTIASNGVHSQGSQSGSSDHHSKSKSTTTHRTPCTNYTTGLSHSYYDCCINVHVSGLLDHWLDWPSNHCLPHMNPSERNGFSDPNHQQQNELHSKEESSPFNGTMQEKDFKTSDNLFLYSLVSSQHLKRKSETISLSSLTS